MKKMVEFLKSFAMSYGVDYVIEYLEKNKDEVIKRANKKLNLPVLNEKQEAQLLEASLVVTAVTLSAVALPVSVVTDAELPSLETLLEVLEDES